VKIYGFKYNEKSLLIFVVNLK